MKPQVCVWQAWSATRRKAARETRRQDGSLAQVTRARAGPICIGGAPLPSPRRRECTIPQGSSGTGLAQATVDAGGGAVQDTIGSLLGTRAGVTVVRARPWHAQWGRARNSNPSRRGGHGNLPSRPTPLLCLGMAQLACRELPLRGLRSGQSSSDSTGLPSARAPARSVRGRRIRDDEVGVVGVAADVGGDERADRYDA